MKRFLLFLAILLSIVSCDEGFHIKNFPSKDLDSATAPYLIVADSIILLPSGMDIKNIKIQSNMDWVIEGDYYWVSVSKEGGNGDQEVAIQVEENKNSETRTATLNVIAGDIIKKIEVIQSNKFEVLEYYPVPGDLEKEIPDLVYVRFNTAVKVKYISSRDEGCYNDVAFAYSENNHAIFFNHLCFKLGGHYAFDISLENSDGVPFTESIEVDFFTKKVEIKGYIVDYYVSEKDNSYWVLTKLPANLYQISMDDLRVMQHRAIPMEGVKKLKVSSFHNEVYVLGNYTYIAIYDAKTLNARPVIHMPVGSNDHPQAPLIYPYDVHFTKKGLGIVLVGSPHSSAIRWQMIDKRNNNRIYTHSQYSDFQEPDKFPYFSKIYANYDHSKLFLTYAYGDPTIAVFDQDTELLHAYRTPSYSQETFLTPNRKNNRIFFGMSSNQLIADPFTGYYSSDLYIGNRNGGSADFSYKENESESVYFCDNDFLRVINYYSQSVRTHKIIYHMRGATTTTDGKHLILYNPTNLGHGNGAENHSLIFQFSTDGILNPNKFAHPVPVPQRE